ncbi:MAG: putative toxin-antitoxin system toxin component, PIN family [Bifidobacteriaceae bacterium]|jgi:putative PIN family toxin of toxin-antitoxin system|nr:putative toxin-antitoxin system toxin component, PIN family [Bifidobacteriaceae bacterium]
MRAVIDTNVLVSALLNPSGAPARVLALVNHEKVTPYFDARVLQEYREVPTRDEFGFDHNAIRAVLAAFTAFGQATTPPPLTPLEPDPDDTPFYEVAVASDAILITGNLKHYPEDPRVRSPGEFLSQWTGPSS